MATALKFLNFRSHSMPGLCPAPSIADWVEINDILKNDTSERLTVDPDTLMNRTIKILANYRGGLVFTEGGLSIVRHAPKTIGGNQYTGWPNPGLVEEVTIGEWIARVEFV